MVTNLNESASIEVTGSPRDSKAHEQQKAGPRSGTLFFARVPPKVPAEDLQDLFSRFGTVLNLTLFKRWPTAKSSKGCGLVQFSCCDDAQVALDGLNGVHRFDKAFGATIETTMVVEWANDTKLQAQQLARGGHKKQHLVTTSCSQRLQLVAQGTSNSCSNAFSSHPSGQPHTSGLSAAASAAALKASTTAAAAAAAAAASTQQQAVGTGGQHLLQWPHLQSQQLAGDAAPAAQANLDNPGCWDKIVPLHLLVAPGSKDQNPAFNGSWSGNSLLLQQQQQQQQQLLLPPSLDTTLSGAQLLSHTSLIGSVADAGVLSPYGHLPLLSQSGPVPPTFTGAFNVPGSAGMPTHGQLRAAYDAGISTDNIIQVLPVLTPCLQQHGVQEMLPAVSCASRPALPCSSGTSMQQHAAATSHAAATALSMDKARPNPTQRGLPSTDLSAALTLGGVSGGFMDTSIGIGGLLPFSGTRSAAAAPREPAAVGTAEALAAGYDEQMLAALLSGSLALLDTPHSGGTVGGTCTALHSSQAIFQGGPQPPLSSTPASCSSYAAHNTGSFVSAVASCDFAVGSSSRGGGSTLLQQQDQMGQVRPPPEVVLDVALDKLRLGQVVQQAHLVMSLSGAQLQLTVAAGGMRLRLQGSAAEVEAARSLLTTGTM